MQNFKKISWVCLLTVNLLSAQYVHKFQNPNLPQEERVKSLIAELTIDEKIAQLMSDAPAIERLGIPKYDWWNEAIHGVARSGYATVFPQSITMAGSWNENLMFDVANAISDEVRAKHHEYKRNGQHDIYQGLTIWSPNINIFRDPRWGRGHETYGEDPFLTAQMGLQFVKGLQGNDAKYLKAVATAKHYAVHSGPEPLRHEFNVNVSQRDLWETYLPAFRTVVQEGKVYSIMTAYNRVRGEAASASPLLFDILRDKWKFDGYVVSDCGAIADIYKDHKIKKTAAEAAALALEEGCDLNCGSTYKELKAAISEGIITEDKIDLALTRLYLARFKLGMFDEDSIVPFAQIPFSVNTNEAHNYLARKASQESIILLKNEKNVLPLSKGLKKIAVIGPNANNVQSLLGNYNGNPKNPITVLSGIQNKVSPKVEVVYEEGCPLAEGLPTMEVIPSVYFETANGKQGLKAEYFDNTKWEGQPLFTQTDDQVNFNWDVNTPHPKLKMGNYSVRWSGFLVAPETGDFYFSNWAKPFQEFTIGENEKEGGKFKHHPKVNAEKIHLEKGKKYPVEVKYKNNFGDATAQLLWSTPKSNQLEKAVALAKSSDVIILALGLNDRLEGEEMGVKLEGFEGGDRTSLDLPKTQENLLKEMIATQKPVIVVLLNGSALSINYAADNAAAIVAAGYPGQQGGNAIADVLFGDYNPGGRLPVTYYKSVNQLPAFENYDMKGRTYRYFTQEPLYPFGFGLSYTSFEYSDLKLPNKINTSDNIKFQVKVKNSGKTDGDEVVQVYVTDEKASTPRPIRQLVGFKRIFLKAGETKEIEFEITNRQLALINKKEMLVVEPGWFTISVGGEQPKFKGRLDAASTQTTSSRFQMIGKIQKIAF
ncbi:glycoside hydrolase family 3 C-terminal domain-containing protein [Flavobacterium agrisoli]|uniref:Glycoside hydrolase family 3 C-terminal domain-containing protein n=1 Tax=Flavobacterium agrisoli TaxID=2793066 RepID=A0A934UK49_9FLAO|nr:glycoside hydrolase family 3 C-terminal domain-containing protein [Flavobacterium agrisoli]MBK0370199.1 glycoside hydrolase family 3 C-terminal domain-containing protein [Flavobacterium agrisoli]